MPEPMVVLVTLGEDVFARSNADVIIARTERLAEDALVRSGVDRATILRMAGYQCVNHRALHEVYWGFRDAS